MNKDPNTRVHAVRGVAEPAPRPRPRRGGRLDPEARERIARGLRLLYAETLSQPVPDALETLAAALAARLEDSR